MAINAFQFNPDDLKLRKAEAKDSLCLSVLAMQVFLDTYATNGIRPEIAREALSSYSRQVFCKAIAEAGTHVLVAEYQRHMVGFAQITSSANHDLASTGTQAELLRLYVQEPFTRVNVGTKLLAEAESYVSSTGASVLWLTAWIDNQRALTFYAKRGYGDYGPTYYTFEGESHECRLLAKVL